MNDESDTLLNETVTIQEGFSDDGDDYALLDDLEFDGYIEQILRMCHYVNTGLQFIGDSDFVGQ